MFSDWKLNSISQSDAGEGRLYENKDIDGFVFIEQNTDDYTVSYRAISCVKKESAEGTVLEVSEGLTDEREFGTKMKFDDAVKFYFDTRHPKFQRTMAAINGESPLLRGWYKNIEAEWYKESDQKGDDGRIYRCKKYDPYAVVEIYLEENKEYTFSVYWKSLDSWQDEKVFGKYLTWDEAEKEFLNNMLPEWESKL